MAGYWDTGGNTGKKIGICKSEERLLNSPPQDTQERQCLRLELEIYGKVYL
jgi:hypothetical protein